MFTAPKCGVVIFSFISRVPPPQESKRKAKTNQLVPLIKVDRNLGVEESKGLENRVSKDVKITSTEQGQYRKNPALIPNIFC